MECKTLGLKQNKKCVKNTLESRESCDLLNVLKTCGLYYKNILTIVSDDHK
jgi:hypothetical protein